MGRSNPWKRWLSLRAYGLVTSTLFRASTPPKTMRARFERLATVSRTTMKRSYPKLVIEDHPIGPLAMESVRATPSPSRAIVHLHGGAFVFGSPDSYRARARRLSYRCNAEVFVPHYRLAPEHPYPAALDDALVAWQYVRALRRDRPVFVSGDSAGGGLALSLLVRLRDFGAEMPCGGILLSPWTDMTASGASVGQNRGRDRWLKREHLEAWASYYVGAADPRDPALSPVFADVSSLPPLLLLAGEDEVLLDDARRVASAAGTSARLVIGKRMQHDWPFTVPWLEESREAWTEIERFVTARSHPTGAGRRQEP